MKKNILIALGLFLAGAGVYGQTSYEALRLTGGDLNGTARFVGMGGAMGSLGGDISTMFTNPAGIGLYRSSDLNLSLSVTTLGSKSKFNGTDKTENKTTVPLDEVGFVWSNNMEQSSLRYLNFGFAYKRHKGFSKNFTMTGGLSDGNLVTSQQQQMSTMLNGFDQEMTSINSNTIDLGGITSDDYRYPFAQYGSQRYYVPWLVLLAADGGLLDNSKGTVRSLPTNCYYHGEEKGGVDEFDMNFAINLNDQFYFGATVGLYYVDYNRYSYYEESDNNGLIYSLENWYGTDGNGFDIKLGTVIRPIEDSPFRFGLAVHTPTWYRLTDKNAAYLFSDFTNDKTGKHLEMDTRWSDAYGDDYYTDYRLQTPWVFNASMGYTFGSMAALGLEYEYADYSTSKLKYDDGDDMSDANDMISNNFKGVSTFKAGLELRPVPQFAFRLGFNNMTAACSKSSYKTLPLNSVQTDTEYLNALDAQNYTFGLGYTGDNFYLDMAYQYSVRHGEFYPFDNTDLSATKVTDSRSQLLFTIGTRF